MTGKELFSNRAVSDVIAFVLTFSVIVSAVGFIYISGFDALEEVRMSEDVNSGERSVRGIAETFEDIHRNGAPGRSIEIGVDDGSLTLRESTLDLTITTDAGTLPTQEISVGALVMTPVEEQETVYVYENGAVFRDQEAGGLLRHRPVISCTDDAAILSVVKLRGDVSVGSTGTVRLIGQRGSNNLLYPDTGAGQTAEGGVEIEVDVSDTRSPDLWSLYFQRADNWSGSGSTFTCDNVERIFVRQTTIRLSAIS